MSQTNSLRALARNRLRASCFAFTLLSFLLSLFPSVFLSLSLSLSLSQEAACLPRPCYMESQQDINGKMRAILIDWLVEAWRADDGVLTAMRCDAFEKISSPFCGRST